MKVLVLENAKVKTDAKDLRILKSIIKNSRKSISKIARECLLSRQSAEYRIRQMEEKGLISGYKTVINIRKIGYKPYHVFLRLQNTNDERILMERMIKAKFVNAVITYTGRFNFEISVMARNEEEFLKYYYELVDGINVSDENILIISNTLKSEVLPRGFFGNLENRGYEKNILNEKKGYGIDKTDIKIMKILSNDSSITDTQLGEMVDLSKDAIAYRIKKLIVSDYILQFRPAINYYVLGLSIHTVLLKLNHNINKIKDFESYQKGNEAIMWSARTFGSFDYIFYILTSDLSDFHKLFDSIKEKYGDLIKTYELLFAHTEHKYSFMAESVEL